jgi:hypothetical protein
MENESVTSTTGDLFSYMGKKETTDEGERKRHREKRERENTT